MPRNFEKIEVPYTIINNVYYKDKDNANPLPTLTLYEYFLVSSPWIEN